MSSLTFPFSFFKIHVNRITQYIPYYLVSFTKHVFESCLYWAEMLLIGFCCSVVWINHNLHCPWTVELLPLGVKMRFSPGFTENIFVFSGSGNWAQGLWHGNHMLYRWSNQSPTKDLFLNFLYAWVFCLRMCFVPSALWGQRRASDPLELEV